MVAIDVPGANTIRTAGAFRRGSTSATVTISSPDCALLSAPCRARRGRWPGPPPPPPASAPCATNAARQRRHRWCRWRASQRFPGFDARPQLVEGALLIGGGGRRRVRYVAVHLRGHQALGGEFGAALRATLHVRFHPLAVRRLDAPVGQPGQQGPGFGVRIGDAGTHDFSPDIPASSGSTCLSVSRARNRRVFTVLTGQSRIAATSSQEWPRV